MKEIDRQYKYFIRESEQRKITRYDDILKQLDELKIESQQRLYKDYTYIIKKIECVFRVKCNSRLNQNALELYKQKLLNLIEEIYNNLQGMKCYELEQGYLISSNYPSHLHYPLEKLSNAMWGGSELYAFTAIQQYLDGIIDFEFVESIEEIYTLTLAGLFIKKYCS